jgi:hypothetical protein
MSRSVSWLDRIRIELLVWALDQRLYDLPYRSRIARRREFRQNLLAAARDVGTTRALRHQGSSYQLAEEYLTAQYGAPPRHSWVAAAYVAGLIPLALNFFMSEAMSGDQAAITSASPHVTGTFTVPGISYLQHAIVCTFTDGHGSLAGGSWTLTCYLLCLAAAILAGRLWCLPLSWARRRGPFIAPGSKPVAVMMLAVLRFIPGLR